MKTIKEWFELVEDDKLRKELLDNYDESYNYFENKANTISRAIDYGFEWSETKQGQDYWNNIYNSEIKIKQQTPTKEEVIEHFKDAELIQCLSSKTKGILVTDDINITASYVAQDFQGKKWLILWTKEQGYAKILKYKNMNKVKNKEATHYEIWKDFEAIDIIKSTLTDEEYKGYLKGNILKYKLREKGQDESDKIKIKDYTNELNDLI
ncbi:DUF3310 domain-containing protein [Seonamhaeicola sp.]|uniref:DUF3310 domain-containing protein n=1 Tax=Seonamhaeicola sp. TaxID=1912245 RepID=UPI003568033C